MNVWKLNTPEQPLYQRKDQKKRIHFETNGNGNIPKPMRASVAVLEEKCIMINALIKTHRIQSQPTRIGSASIHKQLSEREIKKKKSPLQWHQNNKILRDKLSLRGEKPVQ